MQLTVKKNHFLKALLHGSNVVAKRTTIPVLSHVLLSANENNLTVSATDIDLVLVEQIPAAVESSGEICVPANLLYDIVRKLPDKAPILLSQDVDKMQLNINSGRSNFTLNGLSSDDFPPVAQTTLAYHFDLPAQQLKYLIDNTRFAMDTANIRHNLNGIYFHTQKINEEWLLRAVATNLHRLGSASIIAPKELTNIPIGIIVSSKSIVEIKKLIDDIDSNLRIGLSENRIEILIEASKQNIIFSSRLLEGNFPAYQNSVITSDTQSKFKVNTKNFLEAIDRVSTIISDQEQVIKLSLSADKVKLTPISYILGLAEEELDVQYSGNAMELLFNVNYIMDIIKLISSKEMVVYLGCNDGQVLFRPDNEGAKEVYLLMPIDLES